MIHSSRRTVTFPSMTHSEITVAYFGNLGGKRQVHPVLNALVNQGVKLELFGQISPEYIPSFGDRFHGALEWEEMIIRQSSVDLVLICITREEHCEYAIPGKIYETIGIGVPILLYCPRNAAAKCLLEGLDYAFVWVDSDLQGLPFIALDEMSGKLGSRSPPIRESEFAKLLEILG